MISLFRAAVTLRCWLPVVPLALFSVGCTRFQALDATIPSWNYQRSVGLSYGPDPRQKLDVYVPRSRPTNAPVVVFFYGGDWQAGKKSDYRFVAEALASRGIVAVLPDYRLYPQVKFPAFVQDGALAARWTQDHIRNFEGDSRSIFLMGHSAGAHIAALLALDHHYLADAGFDRSDLRGAICLSGPYDFVPPPGDAGPFNYRGGGTPDPRIEPIHFADGADVPLLLIHGLKDDIVGSGNADALFHKIRQLGGKVRYIAYPCRGHVGVVLALASHFRWLTPTLADTADFVYAHKAAASSPASEPAVTLAPPIPAAVLPRRTPPG